MSNFNFICIPLFDRTPRQAAFYLKLYYSRRNKLFISSSSVCRYFVIETKSIRSYFGRHHSRSNVINVNQAINRILRQEKINYRPNFYEMYTILNKYSLIIGGLQTCEIRSALNNREINYNVLLNEKPLLSIVESMGTNIIYLEG
jgi:hypothetical protein